MAYLIFWLDVCQAKLTHPPTHTHSLLHAQPHLTKALTHHNPCRFGQPVPPVHSLGSLLPLHIPAYIRASASGITPRPESYSSAHRTPQSASDLANRASIVRRRFPVCRHCWSRLYPDPQSRQPGMASINDLATAAIASSSSPPPLSQAQTQTPAKAQSAAGPSRGAFVVLEGLDRSGKTTQVKLLEQRFVEAGRPVKVMRFPGTLRSPPCPLPQVDEFLATPFSLPVPVKGGRMECSEANGFTVTLPRERRRVRADLGLCLMM